MHSADYAVARRLSARLSVTRRYYVEKAKYIIKLFSSGSHAILVFPRQTIWQYSDGGVECRGMKKRDFLTNISFYLGNDTR